MRLINLVKGKSVEEKMEIANRFYEEGLTHKDISKATSVRISRVSKELRKLVDRSP